MKKIFLILLLMLLAKSASAQFTLDFPVLSNVQLRIPHLDTNYILSNDGDSLRWVSTLTGLTWNGGVIGIAYGGTNISTYTTGDFLYASATNVLSKLPIGSANKILKIRGGLPTWQDDSTGSAGLSYFTESQNTASPNGTVNVTALSVIGGSTNNALALVPKGTGAFQLAISDNASTGGNIRGANATDLQTLRTANTQVASGDNSVITGGYKNKASGKMSFVGSGINNSANDSLSVILGGYQNTAATGSIGSAISGGQYNETDGDFSTIAGGYQNIAYASKSVVSGGEHNYNYGSYSTISGGYNNQINSAGYSTIAGGIGNTINSSYDFVFGNNLTASAATMFVFGGCSSCGSGLLTYTYANSAIFSNADLALIGDDSVAHSIRLYAATHVTALPGSIKYTGFKAGLQTTSVIYTLPLADATVLGSALTSNAAGTLAWIAPMSAVTAPATTGTMSIASSTSIHTVVGIVPTGGCTFNAPAGIAGQTMTFSITTSGTSSYNLNWNTNYKSQGTLATGTVTAKTFTVTFICADGTVWHETGRTTAM